MRSAPGLQTAVVLTAGLLLMSTRTSAAERQLRPFVGATFAGATTIVDPEGAVKSPNLTFGGSAAFLGEIFGAEVDVSDVPGMFGSDKNLVKSSRVTTFSGNFVVAAPHRMTEYGLRPYVVAGAGFMRVRTTTLFGVFDVASTLPALDLGVGALAFVTNKIGVCWDLRRFQDIGGATTDGLSLGDEHLSFWRGTIAVIVRY